MNELDLINRVELKIALTDSDQKLASALNIYLPPLILKLASQDQAVRDKVLSVLEHVNRRLGPNVALPVEKLLDQFHDPKNGLSSLVRSVTLTYVKKGLMLPGTQPAQHVPQLLKGISQSPEQLAQSQFALFLLAIQLATDNREPIPATGFQSTEDIKFLATKFTDLYLLDLKYKERRSCPGVSADRFRFLVSPNESIDEATHSKYKKASVQYIKAELDHPNDKPQDPNAMDTSELLWPSTYDWFVPLVVATTDRLPEVSGPAASLLQQNRVTPDDDIYESFFQMLAESFAPLPCKVTVRVKLMDLIAAAPYDALRTRDLFPIVAEAFKSADKSAAEAAIRLIRNLLTKVQSPDKVDVNAEKAASYAQQLQGYITMAGWPQMQAGNPGANRSDLRSQAYETLGLVMRVFPSSLSLPLVNFLFQSLERDSVSMAPSIQQGLSEVLTVLPKIPEESRKALVESLVTFVAGSEREAAKYTAIRYAVRALPFSSALARTVCFLGLSPENRSDIIDESRRGLHPFYFGTTNAVYGDATEVTFPRFQDMLENFEKHRHLLSDGIMSTAVRFLFECFAMEVATLRQDENWDDAFAAAIQLDAPIRDLLRDHIVSSSHIKSLLDISFEGLINANDSNYTLIWQTILGLSSAEIIASQKGRIPVIVRQLASPSSDLNVLSESLAIISGGGDVSDLLNELVDASFKGAVTAMSYLVARQALSSKPVNMELINKIQKRAIENKDYDALFQLGLSGLLSASGDIIEFLTTTPSEKSILALGAARISDAVNVSKYTDKLLSLNQFKSIDMLLANGEALSIAVSGWQSTTLPQDLKPENTLRTDPELFKTILTKVFSGAKQTSPAIRRSSCVRLLCLVQYSRDDALPYLQDIQACFLQFLADSDEISQESASRGLGLVFERSDKQSQETLVQSLVQSFTSDSSSQRSMAGMVTPDTQLFEPGVLSTGEGSSVSTYKDILSLASEVGDSTLVYKFMSLASSSKLWSSRRGIAFGLESIMERASLDNDIVAGDSRVGKNLIPKLFRYRFDPNTQVQNVMKGIWDALVKDRVTTIRNHFTGIMTELISSYVNREWRVRQASASALANLVETEQWSYLEPYTEELWQIGFRLLDDIKDSVRTAGLDLTKALISVLTRRLESNLGNNKELLDVLIPFLFGPKGIHSKSEEVQTFALSTLIKIVKTDSKDFVPYARKFVEEFVLLLSTLEPQAMNYLALNSANYGVDANALDENRMKSLRQSPMMDALERIVERLDNESLVQLVGSMPNVVRKSVGLPSKVGVARLIISVCTRFPTGADFGPLLVACQAQLADRNDVISQSFAVAGGYICRLASHANVTNYIEKLKVSYFNVESDEKVRSVAGIAMKALSTYASDTFSNEGVETMPFVFMGKFDHDEQVAKIFEEVWTNNTGGEGSIKVYLPEIVTLASPYLTSTSWGQRQTAAKVLAKASEQITSQNDGLVHTLLQSLTGRTWPGKELVFVALVKVASVGTADPVPVLERALTEIKRKNEAYVLSVLPSVGDLLAKYPEEALYSVYFERVGEILADKFEEDVTDDQKIAVIDGVVKSYVPDKGMDTLLEAALLKAFATWKLKIAASKAMGQLGKKGFFSHKVWEKSLETCATELSHENVRLEWVRASLDLRDFGISDDVKNAMKDEKSTIILSELRNGGFLKN